MSQVGIGNANPFWSTTLRDRTVFGLPHGLEEVVAHMLGHLPADLGTMAH